jgi:two-component system chemotaxis response regulator CheY
VVYRDFSVEGYCGRQFVLEMYWGPTMQLDRNMRILIVDDYATMLRILRNLLKQLGFENVHEASDGKAALRQFETNTYDLVISDWNMEPMTGFELLRAVRANPETAQTKFIMITAESATENVIAAKRAGVNNYIIKPFTSEILLGKIEAVFQQQVA